MRLQNHHTYKHKRTTLKILFYNLAMKIISLYAIICFICLSATAQEPQEGTFRIYGHVMTDAGYNYKDLNPEYFDVMRPTQLPAYKNQYGSDGNVFYSVRQSMLGVEGVTPTPMGDLNILFVMDLFGVGTNVGETAFHILYAYAELGKIGVGHNWSLFSDIDASPNVIDYWGPCGLALSKNVQVRYIPFNGQNRFAIALERPGATADEGVYDGRVELEDAQAKFDLPDLSAEFRMTRNWGYAELAGLVRQIKWIDAGEQPYDVSGRAIGWGFQFSSNFKLSKKDVLIAQGVVGEGIQNYMNDAPTDVALEKDVDHVNHPVKGVALPIKSFTLYLNHAWNEKFTSAIGYSAVYIDNTDGQKDDAFRKGQYASANLLYHPTSYIMGGIELQWIQRDSFRDNWISSATTVQFSLRYKFNRFL